MTADLAAMQRTVAGLGGLTAHFAWPYGVGSDFAQQYLQQAGVRYFYTTQPGWVHRGSDPTRIPRINAGDASLDGDALVHLLETLP